MADLNPYQAPQASVADVAHATGNLRDTPQAVAAGQGWQWFVEGFALFRQAPIPWVVISVVMMVVFIGVGLIPFLGQIVSPFVMILLAGGIMQGCRSLDRGDEITLGHLFSGFQTHLGPLVIVAALYFAALLLLVVLAGVVGFGSVMGAMQGGAGTVGGMASGVLIVFLVIAALSIPIAMAIWFAPALIVLNDIPPVEALKRSFGGCLRNILPFIVYGIVGFVLAVVASIPFLLGWLVLFPVLAGSIYSAYRDIFLNEAA